MNSLEIAGARRTRRKSKLEVIAQEPKTETHIEVPVKIEKMSVVDDLPHTLPEQKKRKPRGRKKGLETLKTEPRLVTDNLDNLPVKDEPAASIDQTTVDLTQEQDNTSETFDTPQPSQENGEFKDFPPTDQLPTDDADLMNYIREIDTPKPQQQESFSAEELNGNEPPLTRFVHALRTRWNQLLHGRRENS